jgi:mRNA interferase RelE/StbE
MGKYKVFIRASASKELAVIPKKSLHKIIGRIWSLEENPRPLGCEKLSAQERYRLRQGNYRIVYSIQDKEQTIHIVKIGHRKEIYRQAG